jgi:hypothetical protein
MSYEVWGYGICGMVYEQWGLRNEIWGLGYQERDKGHELWAMGYRI